MPIESYIVRIYRRDDNDPHAIAGTVESAGTEEKKSFTSSRELLRILSLSGPIRPQHRNGRAKG
jgi:hypothetical protein